MIDNSNVSVKKQKLSNDVEETNNILAEPKRRTDQVRPAILSQPSVDDGDNRSVLSSSKVGCCRFSNSKK